jgi:hemoglobin/transferrin/lactoferrin receptor protein
MSIVRGQTATLAGCVVDAANGRALPDAVVLLLETGQKKNTTDEGRFTFGSLAAGQYTLSVHHIAFGTVERSIVLSSGERESVFVSLQPAIFQSEEVVVRSTRTSSALNDSPYPMEVKSRADLVQQAFATLPEALKRTSGVSLVRDGAWETAISIRGLSRSNIVSLVDNVRIETTDDIAGALSLVSIEDLERAEVIKASASTLYGSGALGGVLHLVTKRASFSDEPQTTAQYVAGTSSVDGGLSQHISLENSTGRYALRASVGYRKAGNTMTPEGAIPNSQYSDFSIYSSLGVKTVGDQSVLFTYQRSQAEDAGIPGGAPIALPATASYTLARRELLGVEYQFPNLSPVFPLLVLRLSRQEIDRNVQIIQSPTITVTPHATHTTTNIQLESRISPFGNDLLTFGIEAWQRDLISKRERHNTASGVITGERPVPSSTFFSGGVYVQDEWHRSTSPVTVVAGARFDRIRVKNDAVWNPEYVISGGVVETTPLNQQLLWDRTTVFNESWSANTGLTYAFNPLFEMTFLCATAYRAPSLEERFQFIDLGNLVRVGNPTLQPERSISANAGVSLHSEGSRVQSDIFLNQLSNLVTEVPGVFEGRPAFIKANIGQARLYGYEISGEMKLLSWSALKFSVSYVRGEDTRSHLNLPQISPLQGQISLSAFANAVGSFEFASSFAVPKGNLATGEVRTSGNAVFDAGFAGVPLKVWSLSLTIHSGIQNILNKDYREFISTLRGAVQSEPGRNYYLSVAIAL